MSEHEDPAMSAFEAAQERDVAESAGEVGVDAAKIAHVVRRRWDHNRYAPWLDERSPHYGDAEHFVRLVLATLTSPRDAETHHG
jgi:hypothetical protein